MITIQRTTKLFQKYESRFRGIYHFCTFLFCCVVYVIAYSFVFYCVMSFFQYLTSHFLPLNYDWFDFIVIGDSYIIYNCLNSP